MADSTHKSTSFMGVELTAPQMASLSVLFAALAAIGYAAFDLLHFHTRLLRIIVPAMIGVLGLIGWLIAINRLKNGVQNGDWPEQQVNSLRTVTESPFLPVLALVMLGIFLFFAIPQHTHSNRGWAGYVVAQCCLQLKYAAQRRLPTSTVYRHHPIITSELKALQSNHWGER